MAFTDHYTRAIFAKDVAYAKNGVVDKDIMDIMSRFLEEVVASGRMGRIKGVEGRDINVAKAWNGLLDGGKPDIHWSLAMKFALAPSLIAIETLFDREDRDWDSPLTEAELDKTYALLCQRMDDGNLDVRRNTPLLENLQDSATGDSIRIIVKEWQPLLERMDETYKWVAAHDIIRQPLAAVAFDVPSGHLLLSDFIRVDGVTQAIKNSEKGIGSAAAQLAATIALAANHDMAYCQTSNTTISAWQVQATGAIALYDGTTLKDDAGLKSLGSFSCGVWRITAIDKEVLKRLAIEGGNAGGDADVERHLALADAPNVWPSKKPWAQVAQKHSEQCDSRNILRLKVVPGEWTLHCGKDFSKRARRRKYGLPKGGTLWAVLIPSANKNKFPAS